MDIEGKWYYQTVERDGVFKVYEVFTLDGRIVLVSDEPVTLSGMSAKELKQTVQLILADIDRPVVSHAELLASVDGELWANHVASVMQQVPEQS